MGLLTGEIARDVASEGFAPQAVSSAVAMSVGIYSLIIGLFNLGFLLEFVSIPVLNGFISATGIVIMLGQIPSLFGVPAATGTAHIIHDLFKDIPHFQGPTIGIGFGGIFLLLALQKMGAKWGKKSKVIWILSLSRSAIVLVLFTGISYGVNKNINLKKHNPKWELSKVTSNGIKSPIMPAPHLIQKVFARSIAPFIAVSVEHLAIGKNFARKYNYVLDPTQELVYLGVTNFFNSFFLTMPVGGGLSRAAVSSATGVRSPAFGLFTGAFVVLAIVALSPALFWIPKATLAAIIVTAVWQIIHPPKTFYAYWKTSLVDFVASMLAFWVTLFVSSEAGIGSAVGFNILYHVLFSAFARIRRVSTFGDSQRSVNELNASGAQDVPLDSQVFKCTQSIIFYNAYCVKRQCFDVVQTFNSGVVVTYEARKIARNWSVSGARRMARLRKRAGIVDEPPAIRIVVLDMSMVASIDTTGLTALRDLRVDLLEYGGQSVELRFVDVHKSVRKVFERFGWILYNADSVEIENRNEIEGNPVYKSLVDAITERSERVAGREIEAQENKAMGSEKA